MDIGERIFQHRKRLGLSQEELAARLGVSRQAVSKWELGTSTPEPENIIALARIFGITTDELLMGQPSVSQTATPDGGVTWLDRLPSFLGRLFRRFGWLTGVYLAVFGLAACGLALLARTATRQMYRNVPSFFHEEAASMSQPMQTMTTAVLIIGGVFAVAGIVLAVLLFRRRKK